MALVFALAACNGPRAGNTAADNAALFTIQHAKHQLRAAVAGSDCHVLVIETKAEFDDDLVESIQYGIGDYDAFGGADQFAQEHGFRAVVYRDSAGALWTYGATTRDEAQSMPRCR
ncbi:MAG: hypothetical protein DMF56_01160 [Acidobacteria bacterium]|nr:MAG: hypothetical protein DMF56_01160 [Acidobacteriota bacterium]